jgi:hypothetical protein
MANELITSWNTGNTIYFHVFNAVGQIWNTVTVAFEAYVTANIANYAIAATEQGSASGYYRTSFPSAIVAGVYSIYAKLRSGGSPAESDLTVGNQYGYNWSGSLELSLNGVYLQDPLKIQKAVAFSNFSFMMYKSGTNTPATGLSVTATRSLDGAAFVTCTNSVSELGNGYYLISLSTSDVNANVVNLRFSATGADDTDITIYTQGP